MDKLNFWGGVIAFIICAALILLIAYVLGITGAATVVPV
jgi:hypothetical protein